MDDAIRDAFNKIGIAGQDIFTEKSPGYVVSESDPPDCPDAATLLDSGRATENRRLATGSKKEEKWRPRKGAAEVKQVELARR